MGDDRGAALIRRVYQRKGADKPRSIDYDWPPMQRAVWSLLRTKDRDVPISKLFKRMYPELDGAMRYKQQRVGAVVALINVKIVSIGRIIKPGIARHTYRNYPLSAFK